VTIPPSSIRVFPIITRFLVILVKDLKAISFALIVEKLIILLRHAFSSMDFLLDIEVVVKEVLQISNLLLAWLKHILMQLHNMVPWRIVPTETSFVCPKISTMPS